ncbi:MAG: Holliday junction resolvase RuvX, partial [Lachnospiraceae bacterium]|nr:Holliday junction resolvase RuvX [Lachnospiraceae bacterium]
MKIMGVDYGKSRIGCAVSDALGMIANPIGTLHETYFPKQVQRVVQWVEEYRPEQIVVGLPRHMNGDEGDSAQMARDFAKELEEASGVPCVMRDERMTTVMAHKLLN